MQLLYQNLIIFQQHVTSFQSKMKQVFPFLLLYNEHKKANATFLVSPLILSDRFFAINSTSSDTGTYSLTIPAERSNNSSR